MICDRPISGSWTLSPCATISFSVIHTSSSKLSVAAVLWQASFYLEIGRIIQAAAVWCISNRILCVCVDRFVITEEIAFFFSRADRVSVSVLLKYDRMSLSQCEQLLVGEERKVFAKTSPWIADRKEFPCVSFFFLTCFFPSLFLVRFANLCVNNFRFENICNIFVVVVFSFWINQCKMKTFRSIWADLNSIQFSNIINIVVFFLVLCVCVNSPSKLLLFFFKC